MSDLAVITSRLIDNYGNNCYPLYIAGPQSQSVDSTERDFTNVIVTCSALVTPPLPPPHAQYEMIFQVIFPSSVV